MFEVVSLVQSLRIIGEYQWVIGMLLLPICLYLPTKTKIDNSNVASIAASVIIGGLSYRYGLLILQTNPDIQLTQLQLWLKTHKEVMLFVWYFGFCFIDTLAMFVIYLLHKKFNLPNSFFTKTLVFGYFSDAIINLLRLGERYLLGTDYLQPLYRWGIPGINIGVALVALFIIGRRSYHYLMVKNCNV